MDERRPGSIPVTPPRPVSGAKLSPLQRAGAAYRDHMAGCRDCRTTDGGRCEEALRLWRIHGELCDAAYAELAAERRY
ncbi:hypothetical protein [Streptomyces sp. NPDC003720]|uniref:hypothetical protein n=1 Tax=Streptomyces sp. NPDC003720 TaxID=3364684 RepID=UPI0036BED5B1